MFYLFTMIGWIRLIVFTILVPGTVAGYIPHQLIKNIDADWQNQPLKWIGFLIIIAGIIIYLLCAINFLLKGLGTPNIWFARGLKFIMGEEPTKMVSSGLYKYSRNPMYLGVLTTVLGEMLFYQRAILLHYLFFLFILFHLVVIMIEEPHLKKKFGKDYEQYKKQTRRWL
jgi:protein-S-isoprenylcysteine O-methyltransferase Ste14